MKTAEELNALTDEMNAIEERKNELRAEAQAKVEESRKVAEGEIGETIKPVSVKEEERKMVLDIGKEIVSLNTTLGTVSQYLSFPPGT